MTKKHLPTRTCIACRRIKPKQDMIRIVRNPDGIVELDESGKANGRGGYLCQHLLCWQRALRRRGTLLKRALKADLDYQAFKRLKSFSEQYRPPEEIKQTEATPEGENKVEGESTAKADTQAENVSDANAQPDSTTDEQATTQKENPSQNVTEEKKEESS